MDSIRSIPILKAKGLTKAYGDRTIIPGMDFVVDDIEGMSEIISILGPSGCGKSTLLKLIAGLEMPSAGALTCMGETIQGPGRDRGMVFQKYSSFPFLSVIDNIVYPLVHVKKMPRKDAQALAEEWVGRMHLEAAAKQYPHQLSGGMQQRVAIARSLAMQARILLMDEPFGALDRKIRWEMQDLLAELAFLRPAYEFTVFLVTHDIAEAVYLGDRVWVMHKGSLAHTKEIGRPSEPARAAQGRKEFLDTCAWFSEELDRLVV